MMPLSLKNQQKFAVSEETHRHTDYKHQILGALAEAQLVEHAKRELKKLMTVKYLLMHRIRLFFNWKFI